MQQPIPNFFIVGAPKAGTTALHAYLDQHPEVFMSAIKEPDYFTWEAIEQQQLYYGDSGSVKSLDAYLKLFEGSGRCSVIGEGSVSYLFYPETAQKLQRFNPESKILIVLRNPVKRAISHYNMDHRLGFVRVPLSTIVQNGPDNPETRNYYQQYVQLGEYHQQVKRYLDAFGDKVLVLAYQKELTTQLPEICRFLNIDPTFEPADSGQKNTGGAPANELVGSLYRNKALRGLVGTLVPEGVKTQIRQKLFSRNKEAAVDESLTAQLTAHYQTDIEQLEALLGYPISNKW